MGNYSAAWRFEVLVSTKGKAERWITYGSGLAGAEGSIAGEHEDDEAGFWYDDPVALAQNRLEEALEVLGAFRGGVPSRIVLWTEVGTPENRGVVIQATEQQMATGRLRAASSAVVRAATELNNARRFLRE